MKIEIQKQVIPEDVAREQFEEATSRWYDPRVPRSLGRHALVAVIVVAGAGLSLWAAIRGNQDTLQDAIRPVVEEEMPGYIDDATDRIEGRIDRSVVEATDNLGDKIDSTQEEIVTSMTGGN